MLPDQDEHPGRTAVVRRARRTCQRTGIAALLIAASATAGLAQAPGVALSGELKRWHKVTVTLDGPATSAAATPNPFLDLRMDVTFTHAASKTVYRVPGFFAGDGNAANSSASGGNKWSAILAPDQVGRWTYRISFRQGPNVAVADSATAGTALTPFDGRTGSFSVVDTDKSGRDFRGKGMLKDVNKHHLQFGGIRDYFLKVGSDSPENLLGVRRLRRHAEL